MWAIRKHLAGLNPDDTGHGKYRLLIQRARSLAMVRSSPTATQAAHTPSTPMLLNEPWQVATRHELEPEDVSVHIDEVNNVYYAELADHVRGTVFKEVRLEHTDVGIPLMHCAVPKLWFVEVRVERLLSLLTKQYAQFKVLRKLVKALDDGPLKDCIRAQVDVMYNRSKHLASDGTKRIMKSYTRGKCENLKRPVKVLVSILRL